MCREDLHAHACCTIKISIYITTKCNNINQEINYMKLVYNKTYFSILDHHRNKTLNTLKIYLYLVLPLSQTRIPPSPLPPYNIDTFQGCRSTELAVGGPNVGCKNCRGSGEGIGGNQAVVAGCRNNGMAAEPSQTAISGQPNIQVALPGCRDMKISTVIPQVTLLCCRGRLEYRGEDHKNLLHKIIDIVPAWI